MFMIQTEDEHCGQKQLSGLLGLGGSRESQQLLSSFSGHCYFNESLPLYSGAQTMGWGRGGWRTQIMGGCPSLLSFAAVQYHDQKQVEGEGVYFISS